jgi:hypothetical protein
MIVCAYYVCKRADSFTRRLPSLPPPCKQRAHVHVRATCSKKRTK